MWPERHLRTGSRTINVSKYLGIVCLWSSPSRMFLKYTMDTQPVSSVVCICKRTWDVLKTCGDITLGHDVQGLQDIQLRGKKMHPGTFHGFSKRQPLHSVKSKALACGNFYYSYQKDGAVGGGEQVSGFHRKRMISKLWLLRTREREWLICSKCETHGFLRRFLSTLHSYFSYMKETNY